MTQMRRILRKRSPTTKSFVLPFVIALILAVGAAPLSNADGSSPWSIYELVKRRSSQVIEKLQKQQLSRGFDEAAAFERTLNEDEDENEDQQEGNNNEEQQDEQDGDEQQQQNNNNGGDDYYQAPDDDAAEEKDGQGEMQDDYFDDRLQVNDDVSYIKVIDDYYAYDEDPGPPTLFPLTPRLVIGYLIASCALTLGASGGIGGGGIVVPVYILVMGMPLKVAVPCGAITVLGGAMGSTLLNWHRRHPLADRPLIDWDLVLIMEV